MNGTNRKCRWGRFVVRDGAGKMPNRGFKLVLLGDAAVGKSSLLMRFMQNKFTDGIETTVGAAFCTKNHRSSR